MTCPPDLRAISDEERAVHVAACPACALEMDLAEALPEPCDAARVDRLVDGALEVFARAPKRRPRMTRLRWTLLAAAVLLLGASAAASVLRARWRPPANVAPTLPAASHAVAVPRAPAFTAQPPPIISVEDLPRTAPPPAQSGAHDEWTSASLFAAANASRRRGDDGLAASQYRLLERRFPSSDEAATARVSLALLLLDRQGDAEGALGELDRYLADRPTGSLREESLATRARALAKLGRRDEEKRAWADLLREYPHTLYAETARARMGD